METTTPFPVRVLFLTPEGGYHHEAEVVAALKDHGLSVGCLRRPDEALSLLQDHHGVAGMHMNWVLALHPYLLPNFPGDEYALRNFIRDCREIVHPGSVRCVVFWPGELHFDYDGPKPWAEGIDTFVWSGERARHTVQYIRRMARDLEQDRPQCVPAITTPADP